jgi:hypothetical protein
MLQATGPLISRLAVVGRGLRYFAEARQNGQHTTICGCQAEYQEVGE